MSFRHPLRIGAAAAVVALASQAYAGVNLVENGDFSAGNADFSSDYHFVVQPPSPSTAPGTGSDINSWNEQTYGVGANADLYHTVWANVPAPGGSGDYMIVNGADRRPTPKTYYTVWEQTVAVTPGSTYDFSAEVASLAALSPAKLGFFANGVQIGPSYTAGPVGVWGAFSAVISVGSVTSINLSVEDTNLARSGNDFGLANISLSNAVPEPSIWSMLGLGFASLGFAGYRSRRPAISIV